MTVPIGSLAFFAGVPLAIAAVEGAEAGKTAGAVSAGAFLGGELGVFAAEALSPATPSDPLAWMPMAEVLSLVGAVVGGFAGYHVWRAYKGSQHEALTSRSQLNPRSRANGSKILASSTERYNGGAAIKRQYGSSTVTVFYVYRAEDDKDPSKWRKVEGYGKTPGERKTDAIRRSGLT